MISDVPASEPQTKQVREFVVKAQKKEFERYQEKQREKRKELIQEKAAREANMAISQAAAAVGMWECDTKKQRLESESRRAYRGS